MLNNKIAEYVEEELKPHFGNLMAFVNQIELEKNISAVPEGKDQKFSNQNFIDRWFIAFRGKKKKYIF